MNEAGALNTSVQSMATSTPQIEPASDATWSVSMSGPEVAAPDRPIASEPAVSGIFNALDVELRKQEASFERMQQYFADRCESRFDPAQTAAPNLDQSARDMGVLLQLQHDMQSAGLKIEMISKTIELFSNGVSTLARTQT